MAYRTYRLQKIMAPKLIGVFSAVNGRQLFSARRLRKSTRCSECRAELAKGSWAWGDVTSCGMNRGDRVCSPCLEVQAPE